MGRGKNRGRRMRREQGQASRWNLSEKELDAALAEMDAGSDRVSAIMGAALVENSLTRALMTCLADRSEAAKLFDDAKGPFNSFYAQILAGRALGLYGESTQESLHAVREIRNKFAHAVHSLDFSNPDVSKKVIAKLKRLELESKHHDPAEELTIRQYFEIACYSLTIQITRAGTNNAERQATEGLRKAKAAGLGHYLQHMKSTGLKSGS